MTNIYVSQVWLCSVSDVVVVMVSLANYNENEIPKQFSFE